MDGPSIRQRYEAFGSHGKGCYLTAYLITANPPVAERRPA